MEETIESLEAQSLCDRTTTQTVRHALDRQGGQPHYRLEMLPPQRAVERLLGIPGFRVKIYP